MTVRASHVGPSRGWPSGLAAALALFVLPGCGLDSEVEEVAHRRGPTEPTHVSSRTAGTGTHAEDDGEASSDPSSADTVPPATIPRLAGADVAPPAEAGSNAHAIHVPTLFSQTRAQIEVTHDVERRAGRFVYYSNGMTILYRGEAPESIQIIPCYLGHRDALDRLRGLGLPVEPDAHVVNARDALVVEGVTGFSVEGRARYCRIRSRSMGGGR